MIDIYTFPQRTTPWFVVRLGIISASRFSDVLAGGAGKTRHSYMLKLCNELLSGVHQQGYQSPDMLRGTRQEPAARREYEFITGNSVNEIGFAINNHCGCSPDGLVGADGGIEIKCAKSTVQALIIKAGKMPPKHKPQVQGCMKVMECDWWDFVSYCPDVKDPKDYLFIERIMRDEKYIKRLDNAIELFYSELIEMMEGENNND
jgi:hypothetical protein